jgi:hypothetical protein
MPTKITISELSGSSPFNVYTCDNSLTTCIYISTINFGDIPYEFDLPFILEGMSSFTVKVIDNNNCVISENLS